MKLEIDIPDKIYNAINNGLGRSSIASMFSLSDTDARKFCNAYELSRVINKSEFYEITESDEPEQSAKVLVFDIETAPIKSLTFDIWNQNIGINQILEDWYMLMWSAKWLHDTEVISDRLTGKESLQRNDERVTESIWNLLDKSDIVIAHNGLKFDIKKVNTKFLKYGQHLPSPYQVIDTLKCVKEKFSFTSNKLDFIARSLGLGGKIRTDFDLWLYCREFGDEDALLKMDEYCQEDSRLLEKVYLKIRPYIKNHPNMGIYVDSDLSMCTVCESKQIKEDGFYYTQVSKFQAYRCLDCNAQFRSRKSMLDKDKKSGLMTSLAR